MAFADYVNHVDAQIRRDLAAFDRVDPVAWPNEATARWNAPDRFAEVTCGGAATEVVLHLRSDEFPYDRFADDLGEPDIATTARRIAAFFNENE